MVLALHHVEHSSKQQIDQPAAAINWHRLIVFNQLIVGELQMICACAAGDLDLWMNDGERWSYQVHPRHSTYRILLTPETPVFTPLTLKHPQPTAECCI